MANAYIWVGNTQPNIHAGNQSGDNSWGNAYNWYSGSTYPPAIPAEGDDVTISGYYGYVAPNLPADVTGSGAANSMTIYGPVSLDGTFAVGAGGVTVGSSAVVGQSGSLHVAGDLNLGGSDIYNTVLGVDGTVSVDGMLGFDISDEVDVAGSLNVGSVGPAYATDYSSSFTSLSLNVSGTGSFTDSGDFDGNDGASAVISASGSAQVQIAGVAAVKAVSADNSSRVVFGAISSSNVEFKVETSSARIEIGGGSSARAGQFYLDAGQSMQGGGSITADGIVIGGEIEVQAGAQESLVADDLLGDGVLKIDAGSTLTLDDYVDAAAKPSIVFNGDGGLLNLLGNHISDAQSANGDSVGTIQGFSGDDEIRLAMDGGLIQYEKADGSDLVVTVAARISADDDVASFEVFNVTFAGLAPGDIGTAPVTNGGGTLAGVTDLVVKTSGPSESFVWSGAGMDSSWSNDANWLDAADDHAVSSPPGAADFVSIGDVLDDVVVSGGGEASGMQLDDQVKLTDGEYTTQSVRQDADSSLTIDASAQLTASDDYFLGKGATLQVWGPTTIDGAFVLDSNDKIDVYKSLGVDSVGLGAASGVSDDSFTVFGNGASFVDLGAFFARSGSILASDSANFTVNGESTLIDESIGASDSGQAAFNSLGPNSRDDQISVDATSWVEIGGSSGASAGQFLLDSGETLHGGGSVSAPEIVIDGTLTVSSGQNETLDGALSGNGTIAIDGGEVSVSNTFSTAGGAYGDDSVVQFSGAESQLLIAPSSLDSSLRFEPTLKAFAVGDAVVLQDVKVTSVSYNSLNGVLTAWDHAVKVATLDFGDEAISGQFIVTQDGDDALINLSTGGDTATAPTGTTNPDAYTWTSSTGSWDNSSNWSNSDDATVAPGVDDTISISASKTFTDVVTGVGDAAGLTVSGDVALDGTFVAGGVSENSGANLDVASGGSLDVGADFSGQDDTLAASGGALDIGGQATLGDDVVSASDGGTVDIASVAATSDVADARDNTFNVDATSSIEIGAAHDASAGQFVLDSGQTLSGGGKIVAPAIVIDGTLVVQAGDKETLAGAVSGTGGIEIGAGGELVLGSAAIAAGTVGAAVSGFAGDEKIDLSGLSGAYIRSETVASGGETLLTIAGTVNGAGASVQLAFSGYTSGDFSLVSDGAGGTFVGPPADGYLWTGLGADDQWSTAANWLYPADPTRNYGPSSNDNVSFLAPSGQTIVVSNIGGANSVTLGGAVTLEAGMITTPTMAEFGDGRVTVADDATFDITGTYTIAPGGELTVLGGVSVPGALSAQGATIDFEGGSLTSTNATTLGDDVIAASGGASVALANIAAAADASDRLDNHFTVDASSRIEIGALDDGLTGAFTLDAGQTLSGGGSISASDIALDGVLVVQAGDHETLTGTLSGAGAVQIDAGATLTLAGDEALGGAPTLDFAGASASLAFSIIDYGDDTFASPIAGFVADDTIDMTNLENATIAAQYASGDDAVLVIDGTVDVNIVEETLTFTNAALAGTFSLVSDGASGMLVESSAAPCFARGVRIATTRGEVAVEDLRVDDRVLTAGGATRPVVWIGRRALDLRRHRAPRTVWPVRVARDAFGEGKPRRDLWLSPGHNIAFAGRLIPVSALVNGRSVAQVPRERVEYFHVELDAHDILFSEGLPSESYLDCGNRGDFVNGGDFVAAHPDFAAKHWRETCLPLALNGPPVAAARAHLFERLAHAGVDVVADADPRLIADGERLEPIWLGASKLAFTPPPDRRALRLQSDTFIPAESCLDNVDTRELGLCVGRLQVDGEDIALDDPAFDWGGWRECESGAGAAIRRWTSGDVALPTGARIVLIELAGRGYYWREAERRGGGEIRGA